MIILYVPLKDNLQIRLPRFIKAKIPTYNHNYPKMDELNIIFKKYNLKTIDYKWVGGTLIRSYMSIKYYIKTKLKYLTYFLIPFDYFFAFLDLYPKNFGYGMFFVLKYTS